MRIIGERINATRTPIAEAISKHDADHIIHEIQIQAQAGAHYIDLNAGATSGDCNREAQDMHWLIDLALEHCDKKLSLDSSHAEVLADALDYLDGRRPALLNSVSGEPDRLKPLLEPAARHGCEIIALAMGTGGVPKDVAQRMEVCETIQEEAAGLGIPDERLYFDPLVLPLVNDVNGVTMAMATLREIKARYPKAKTTLGMSNVSHGLPSRKLVNQAFAIAALVNGLDSAICDPTDPALRESIVLGTLLAGKDRHCRGYTRRVKKGEIG
jgi:5-methyltetrahydrofolate--homocysteine methyltransferase